MLLHQRATLTPRAPEKGLEGSGTLHPIWVFFQGQRGGLAGDGTARLKLTGLTLHPVTLLGFRRATPSLPSGFPHLSELELLYQQNSIKAEDLNCLRRDPRRNNTGYQKDTNALKHVCRTLANVLIRY